MSILRNVSQQKHHRTTTKTPPQKKTPSQKHHHKKHRRAAPLDDHPVWSSGYSSILRSQRIEIGIPNTSSNPTKCICSGTLASKSRTNCCTTQRGAILPATSPFSDASFIYMVRRCRPEILVTLWEATVDLNSENTSR